MPAFSVIVALIRLIPPRSRQQADPLVRANRMAAEAAALGEFADLHAAFCRLEADLAAAWSALEGKAARVVGQFEYGGSLRASHRTD
jgi:hypothetical protein